MRPWGHPTSSFWIENRFSGPKVMTEKPTEIGRFLECPNFWPNIFNWVYFRQYLSKSISSFLKYSKLNKVLYSISNEFRPFASPYDHRTVPSPYPTVPHRTPPYLTVRHRTPPYATVPHRTPPYLTVRHRTSPYPPFFTLFGLKKPKNGGYGEVRWSTVGYGDGDGGGTVRLRWGYGTVTQTV